MEALLVVHSKVNSNIMVTAFKEKLLTNPVAFQFLFSFSFLPFASSSILLWQLDQLFSVHSNLHPHLGMYRQMRLRVEFRWEGILSVLCASYLNLKN